MNNNNATIEILSGSNYKRWRSDIEFVLGMMDLDMTLREDEPPKPTNKSTEAMRAHYAKWERSNRLSLISIKRSIVEHLLGGIPKSNNAKEFLVIVANRYQTSDNAEVGHFMDELMNMSQIKVAYNTLNQSWGVNDLITKCVAEEEKLKKEKNESAHLVALGKPNNQKRVEKARKPNFHSHKKNKNFKKSGSEKQKNGNAKNTDLKSLQQKGSQEDSWWLDSGATVHVATSLQGIRNLRKPSEKESKLKVGSDIGIDVEHIGVVVLELDFGFRLVLDNVFCVPSFRRNLISLSVLDKTGYSFTFANKRVDVIYDSKVIGNCVLSYGLYRLSLLSTCSYNVENNVAKRPLTKERSSLLWHKRLGHISKERTAFLNGDLSEEVYMSQPKGFKENRKENMVCKLKRSIYGLKQASRQWYLKFDKIMTSFGFIENKFDQCVYMKDLGEASFVLGIEIYRDRSRNLLGLSQRAYINRVVKRFNMQACKAGDVLVVKGDKLNNEQCPKNDLEKDAMKTIPYDNAIGSLMYAQVCTRPDIAFIINVLGRYLLNPGHDHWVVAKKVMRYLQRLKDFMLVYRRMDNLEVVGYLDSDFGGCSDDRKSTSGYIFMLAGGAISWKSVK
uniref:Uncharacterized protein n=1 Tax=Vitis vinifera TaxID=29760 RepID=A5BX14_VITVI|nr:hypothetical protein VITISV_031251 [Vitis vinifera]